MTGTVAQLIALTSFGNEFLNARILPDNFYPGNRAFQFCRTVEYIAYKKSLFHAKSKEIIIASNPNEWFRFLKNDNCIKLKLYFKSSEDQVRIADYQSAGLVGGGGTWFIESVYDNHSNFWVNNWEVTDSNAIDQKIWTIKYILAEKEKPSSNVCVDLTSIKEEMREILKAIADFAFKLNYLHWGETFDNARRNLDNISPQKNVYLKDFIVDKNYSLVARQLLFSAELAWVFGGMGNWNDMWFESEETAKTYEELTSKLYDCIIRAIIASINS
jgi:hypothetical protein